MGESDRSGDQDLLLALRHPVRRAILRQMSDGRPNSPRELSTALRWPLSNVSYHVRVLKRCAAISPHKNEPVRGSVKHYYLHSVTAAWALEILRREEEGEQPDSRGETPEGPET